MEDNRDLAYFFIGLGLGVAVGMLFAPVSGTEARGAIRHKAAEGGEYLRRRTEEIRESASDVVQRGKQVIDRQRDQLSAAVDAGRQAYREAISSATEPASGTTPGQPGTMPEGV